MTDMKEKRIEFMVGIFVLLGIGAMVYLSATLGELDILIGDGYPVKAEFNNTSGLKAGAVVEVSGVEVGKVESIELNDYQSLVTMRIMGDVELPEDSIASIRTHGIIGEKFVKLSPGGSAEMLAPGDLIIDTESTISIEELISRYIFSNE